MPVAHAQHAATGKPVAQKTASTIDHGAQPARGDDLEAGDVIDGLQIVRVLARSGMGSVFKVHERATGALLVVKVPHMRFESDIIYYSRFQREEKIGLRLEHPAFPRTFERGDKSRPYLAMEYVEGRRLWDILTSKDPIAPDTALDLAKQIAAALVYLHGHRVVHRDLKPENIMIDPDGRVRIVDFGVALDYSDRRLTWGDASSRLGTAEYMAPEQVRGKRGDARTDIYALGTLLYEMLSRASTHQAEDVHAFLRAKLHREPRPLREVAPGVDPRLAAVVMRAIARDPRDRFACAGDMRAALEHPAYAMAPLVPRRARALSPKHAAYAVALVFTLVVLVWRFVVHRY